MKTILIRVQVPDDYSEEQILVCGHEGEIMGIFKSEIIPRPTDEEIEKQYPYVPNDRYFNIRQMDKRDAAFRLRSQIFGEDGG